MFDFTWSHSTSRKQAFVCNINQPWCQSKAIDWTSAKGRIVHSNLKALFLGLTQTVPSGGIWHIDYCVFSSCLSTWSPKLSEWMSVGWKEYSISNHTFIATGFWNKLLWYLVRCTHIHVKRLILRLILGMLSLKWDILHCTVTFNLVEIYIDTLISLFLYFHIISEPM